MSFSEHAFGEHKNQMRSEALEKEVQRLRSISRRQSHKISSLRRTLYFAIFFFVILLSILLIKGLIQFPTKTPTPDLAQFRQTIIDSLARQKPQEDTVERFVYSAHPAAIRKEDFKGIIFSIQIGAYTGIDLEQYENHLMGIKQDSYEGINQFTLGEFVDYTEAVDFLNTIKQMGFQDAFIMSFKNGIRIHIQDAISMKQKENNLSLRQTDSTKTAK
ncbi:MAG: hypothetical protein JEZ14_17300 [Marinilabiliaceae bacterium]|nr:hypothetical protein [Marinilabiliaceae bacterium]